MLTVGVYSSNHRVLYHWNRYNEEISKKCRSVRLSACNAIKKAYSSFIIDSKKLIRVSGERAYHPLQENEQIFKKNSKFLERIFEKLRISIKMPAPLSLLTVE